MLKRCLATLLLVAIVPLAVRGGDAGKPAALIRVQSLDALVDNVKLLVALAGHEDIAKQVEGLVKAKIGVKGLEGIDPARPIGAYARFGNDLTDVGGAVLIPIADEKSFLDLLANVNYPATKGKNDIYTIQAGLPVEVYLRFANRYAYVTAMNASAIEGKLADPMVTLGKDGPTFSIALNLGQLPEAIRQLAAGQVEDKLQGEIRKKLANEPAESRAVLEAAGKDIVKAVTGVIKDGGQFSLAIDLNSKSKELSASVALAGKDGTELAQTIQKLGQTPSKFGGWREPSVAFRGVTHVVLPTELNKALGKLIEKGVADGVEKIQDAGKRAQAQQLADAILPTLRAGELDACIQLVGPGADKKFSLLTGLAVKNGAKLGTVVHDLAEDTLKQIPAGQRDMIKLNHDAVGAVKIHRVDLPADQTPLKDLQPLLGDPVLHLAFRDDAVFIALGKDSLAPLKDILGAKSSGPSPLLSYEVDVARLAPLIAPTDELKAAAQKIFTDAKDGQVRLTLEGGAALRLTLTTRLAVVQFLSQTREAKAGN